MNLALLCKFVYTFLMFKRLLAAAILTLAVLAGLFGMQMETDHMTDMGGSTMHCGDASHPCEPMSQACAAHCLDAALTNHEAPVVSPEVFSGLGLLLVVIAGWALFAREDSEGSLGRLGLLGFSDRLQHVRSTVFRE